jgi:hypothetical protein
LTRCRLRLLSFVNQAFASQVFAKQGDQESRLRITRAKTTTRRNRSEWSALEKPVAPPPTEFCRLPEIRSLKINFQTLVS